MKKLALSLLVIFLLGITLNAVAKVKTTDLDGMSYEDLIALDREIDARVAAMEEENKWLSGEPVMLEPGVYEVGVDIPEGEWTIRPVEGSNTSVEYTTKVDEGKQKAIWTGFISGATLSAEEGETEYEAECTWNLTKETYLVVVSRPAVLSKQP